MQAFTVFARGERVEFTSAFSSTDEAVAYLAEHGTSTFALDLVASSRSRGLSDKQAAWAHKLATDLLQQRSKGPDEALPAQRAKRPLECQVETGEAESLWDCECPECRQLQREAEAF